MAFHSTEPAVGPTLATEVCVEGKLAKALIDTGSPVSLISIEFLLQALLPVVFDKETPAKKIEVLRARVQPPSMVVRNFGGHQVNVICQTTVTLSHKGRKHKVTILVQKNVPLELLLGTDTLGKLGFQLLETEANGEVINLLPADERQSNEAIAKVVSLDSPSRDMSLLSPTRPNLGNVTVKVLKATQIPSHHCQIV